jgi:hypothetical protein
MRRTSIEFLEKLHSGVETWGTEIYWTAELDIAQDIEHFRSRSSSNTPITHHSQEHSVGGPRDSAAIIAG